ncbi:helix-turn-helix domain-containing protein [Clostridium sp. 19966]|uniref:helix-turn-helix domain-containing protein n=1 Tax=Clostridium sp. 19966 TaxID=2768166 RepID=UPI0028DFCE4F|nr:helix-turn-helix domain-containing protein [Clostridium sp. 19966]MDT8717533.1 helix-turn-helix domain-containing protein [Clostridium sp. 19966]
MFDMKDIGRKIALLRREKNLTQMELADKLNISYQAVSNWERGETMPDISKLPEIAEIFNTSIDDILCNDKNVPIIQSIIKENSVEDKIAFEDFKSVAPILKPTQIRELSNEIHDINNINALMEYIPFLSMEVADKLVLRAIESEFPINELTQVLPFVTREVADKIAEKHIYNNQLSLDDFLPFVSMEVADKLALKAIEENHEFQELVNALPFVSRKIADKIVNSRLE